MERIFSKIFKFRRSTVDFLALIDLLLLISFNWARYLEGGNLNSLKRKQPERRGD